MALKNLLKMGQGGKAGMLSAGLAPLMMYSGAQAGIDNFNEYGYDPVDGTSNTLGMIGGGVGGAVGAGTGLAYTNRKLKTWQKDVNAWEQAKKAEAAAAKAAKATKTTKKIAKTAKKSKGLSGILGGKLGKISPSMKSALLKNKGLLRLGAGVGGMVLGSKLMGNAMAKPEQSQNASNRLTGQRLGALRQQDEMMGLQTGRNIQF